MKVFISSDIEGVNGMTDWVEAEKGRPEYGMFVQRQDRALAAISEGLHDSDPDVDILIKDGHGTACNVIHENLPEYTRLFRNSGRTPYIMMHGIDQSFDGAILAGYHSGAGTDGSPLCHTMEPEKIVYMKINDQLADEFLMNYYSALYNGVPVVMVTGDEAVCRRVKEVDPNIVTVAAHTGDAGGVFSRHPNVVNRELREAASRAMAQRDRCSMKMPEHFSMEIYFLEHKQAKRAAWYPGVERLSANVVRFETDDYFELLRAYMFIQ